MENASKALIIAGAILLSILLITIGIVLVNSGSGVADTGTANMNSQKIQTFNAQFTAYEGKKKGSEIKNLVNAVNASNASDPEHQVCVSINSDYNITSASQISNAKTYNVEIYYEKKVIGNCKALVGLDIWAADFKTENGYICRIHIN